MSNELVEKLDRWLNGDQQAIAFCYEVVAVAHVWDDLIDKDKPVEDKAINDVFFAVLLKMPSNPFYRQYQDQLRPIMMSAIAQWQTANILEKGDDNDKDKAFVLRASIFHIIQFCAIIIGGMQWGVDVGAEIWRYYSETKKDFWRDIENA